MFIILVGTPASDKSSILQSNSQLYLNYRKTPNNLYSIDNFVIIDPDDIRLFHPNYRDYLNGNQIFANTTTNSNLEVTINNAKTTINKNQIQECIWNYTLPTGKFNTHINRFSVGHCVKYNNIPFFLSNKSALNDVGCRSFTNNFLQEHFKLLLNQKYNIVYMLTCNNFDHCKKISDLALKNNYAVRYILFHVNFDIVNERANNRMFRDGRYISKEYIKYVFESLFTGYGVWMQCKEYCISVMQKCYSNQRPNKLSYIEVNNDYVPHLGTFESNIDDQVICVIKINIFHSPKNILDNQIDINDNNSYNIGCLNNNFLACNVMNSPILNFNMKWMVIPKNMRLYKGMNGKCGTMLEPFDVNNPFGKKMSWYSNVLTTTLYSGSKESGTFAYICTHPIFLFNLMDYDNLSILEYVLSNKLSHDPTKFDHYMQNIKFATGYKMNWHEQCERGIQFNINTKSFNKNRKFIYIDKTESIKKSSYYTIDGQDFGYNPSNLKCLNRVSFADIDKILVEALQLCFSDDVNDIYLDNYFDNNRYAFDGYFAYDCPSLYHIHFSAELCLFRSDKKLKRDKLNMFDICQFADAASQINYIKNIVHIFNQNYIENEMKYGGHKKYRLVSQSGSGDVSVINLPKKIENLNIGRSLISSKSIEQKEPIMEHIKVTEGTNLQKEGSNTVYKARNEFSRLLNINSIVFDTTDATKVKQFFGKYYKYFSEIERKVIISLISTNEPNKLKLLFTLQMTIESLNRKGVNIDITGTK